MTRVFFTACLATASALFTLAASTLPATAAETVLYSFTDPKLGEPQARLLLHNGTLFGTTFGGSGTAFRLILSGGSWKKKTILNFNGYVGSNPEGGLIRDLAGALYGTAFLGGAYNGGTVYKVWDYHGAWYSAPLWSFSSFASDGAYPKSDLLMDSSGNLYGTTSYGGNYSPTCGEYCGSVFELTQSGSGWAETQLYLFNGAPDGNGPSAGLHMDKSGALFGTTTFGGGSKGCIGLGCGTVFELTQSGGVWTETVLYRFGSSGDGQEPIGGLVEDLKSGALYGTTSKGGAYGLGTVFELTQSGGSWSEKILWSFEGESNRDGATPLAGLTWSGTGSLYGTASAGGANNLGTVFELTSSGGGWTMSQLHDFGSGSDGASPAAPVIVDSTGNVYGTTEVGGEYGWGTVYEITP